MSLSRQNYFKQKNNALCKNKQYKINSIVNFILYTFTIQKRKKYHQKKSTEHDNINRKKSFIKSSKVTSSE